MESKVLVLTSNLGFGELIGQVLQETGRYFIALAGDPEEGVVLAHEHTPDLCVLDCDLEGALLTDLVNDLRAASPNILFVMIPSDQNTSDEILNTLNVDAYLSKPFYLPELITTVEEVLDKQPVKSSTRVPTMPVGQVRKAAGAPDTKPKTAAPEWLKNVNLAAQHLTRLTLESASQAALITRGLDVWAYAGELPQPAVEELANTVSHYFSDGGNTDLARFVRLDAMEADYMLYATGLGGDFVLALVFDAETPFSKIRAQASHLASALASTPPEDIMAETAEVSIIEEDTEPELPAQPLWETVPPPIPDDWVPEKQGVEQREEFLDDLLNDRPASDTVSPMDNPFTRERTSPQRIYAEPQRDMLEVTFEDEMGEVEEAERIVEELQSYPEYLAETMVSRSVKDEVEPEHFAETMLSESNRPVEQEAPAFTVESGSQSMVQLVYACVLIPRMPHHYLTGDLGSRLSEWVTQLSLAFGWRLEQLSIRPEYLQWMANVPPKTSPGYLMRIMRQHTSRRIFAEFPRLADENPSGDFWAPGYLIISSNQAPPPNLVTDFIKETRVRQGAGDGE